MTHELSDAFVKEMIAQTVKVQVENQRLRDRIARTEADHQHLQDKFAEMARTNRRLIAIRRRDQNVTK